MEYNPTDFLKQPELLPRSNWNAGVSFSFKKEILNKKTSTASETGVPDDIKLLNSLVTTYKSLSRKSVESVLSLAETVLRADTELSDTFKLRFYENVGLKHGGSSVRKMRKVGEESPRFQPHLDKLTSNWTTLYQLAKLESHEFQRVVDSEVLHPLVTAAEIVAVVKGIDPKDANVGVEDEESQSFRISIELANLAPDEQRKLVVKLDEVVGRFGLRLETSKEQEELLGSWLDGNLVSPPMKRAA